MLNLMQPENALVGYRMRTFSKDIRQRLGIAVAIMRNTQTILLDESTSDLDPKGADELKEEEKRFSLP